MTEPALIRVFLADDHPIVLAGVRALVNAAPDMNVVGEAADGSEALRQITALAPDVAVLDLSMPLLNGIAVARRLREARSACRVIALTVHEEPAYLRQLLEVGMAGYVLKRSATDELVHAIRAVRKDRAYFDPSIAGRLVERSLSPASGVPAAGAAELSTREKDVLRLTALGHSAKAIAAELALGVKTVDTYKSRAMDKLGFRNRVDVIRYAVTNGWLADT